jgi:nucleotide-binding universal stress UspA family protein
LSSGSWEKGSIINRILMAHDGSEHADKALYWALDVAEKYGASLEALTVVPLSGSFSTGIYPVDGGAPLFGPSTKGLRDAAEKMIEDVLEKAKSSKPSVRMSSMILEGRPADKIVEAAKEGGFDLIVMGSRGLGGVKEFFLGSVSDRVADEATCPVTIVK